MQIGAHRDLKVLEAIETNDRTTQRGLASQLGIALGLTNLYLKRLVRKGYIKCVNVQSNRVRYLITPKGIAEKTRLTYEFMEYSLQVYREGRKHLKAMLRPYTQKPSARIAIYGTGEPAELACLCLRELGLEPVAVFGHGGGRCLGVSVMEVSNHATVDYDLIIVATMSAPEPDIAAVTAAGVPRDKLVSLRQENPTTKAEAVPKNA